MKKKENIIQILLTVFIVLILVACNKEKTEIIKIKFDYQQGASTDYTSYMYYTDDYFANPSTEYNPSLATASLCLAMSSFGSNRNTPVDDYSFRYRNVYKVMENLGFSNIETNKWYKQKPTTDSLGLVFGNKEINGKTLIAIGIRGANYESEWASNCTIGTDYLQHKGFYDSSTIYLTDLKDYIQNNNITGDIMLWSAGYSRAGAVNNLSCARIDKAIYDSEKILGNVNLKKEDLYSYCFEAPMGGSFKEETSPRSSIYNNIFNIINPNDLVPLVAPAYLDFTRYGVDHILPTKNFDPNYEQNIKTILSFYEKMDNYKELGEYKISSFKKYSIANNPNGFLVEDENTNNWTLALFIKDFIDNLAHYGIKDIENYTNNIEDGLRSIFYTLYGNNTPKYSLENILINIVRSLILDGDIDILISDLLHNPKDFVDDIMPYIHRALLLVDENIKKNEVLNGIKELIKAFSITLANDIDFLFSLLNINNIKAIANAHYPELCLAHMMAQDPNYIGKPITYDSEGSYYYITIPYDNDLRVAVDDELLIDKGRIVKTEKYAYRINQNEFILYLQANKKYKLDVNIKNGLKVYKHEQTNRELFEIEYSLINNTVVF